MTQPTPFDSRHPRHIRRMFSSIAPRYDLLNTVLSMGRDRSWRRVAADLAMPPRGGSALDVCTGTGRLLVELGRRVGSDGIAVGVDFCEEMLRDGQRKHLRHETHSFCLTADATVLPIRSGAFDCATVAFGIRNVRSHAGAFQEMVRAVRTGGRVVCLEFAVPGSRINRLLVCAYERTVVPLIGRMLSSRDAYRYLSTSIGSFMRPEEVRAAMTAAGLCDVTTVTMGLGGVCAHRGYKP